MWAVTNASNQCMGAWSTLALSNIGAWGSSAVAKIELTFYGGVPVKRCSDVCRGIRSGFPTPAISVNQNRCLSLQWFSTGAFTRVRDGAPCCHVLPPEPVALAAAGLGFTECRILVKVWWFGHQRSQAFNCHMCQNECFVCTSQSSGSLLDINLAAWQAPWTWQVDPRSTDFLVTPVLWTDCFGIWSL